MIELKVKVSGDEKSYTDKKLIYDEDICLSYEDPKLKEFKQQAIEEFAKVSNEEVPTDLVFSFKMVWL